MGMLFLQKVPKKSAVQLVLVIVVRFVKSDPSRSWECTLLARLEPATKMRNKGIIIFKR